MVNFTDLCKYYKECVFEDGADAIFAKVQNDRLTYIRLENEELTTRNPIEFASQEKEQIQNFIITTKNRTPNSSFWYGFPCSFTTRDGEKFIKPIFYMPIEYDDARNPIIEIVTPSLNKDALSDWGVELETAKQFIDEIDLNKNDKNDLTILELGNKFKERFTQLNYDQIINGRGIYFKGAIFFSEQSKFTKGLYYELNQIIKKDLTELNNSTLKCFIEKNFEQQENNIEFDLKEVYELNENQKKAVASAFMNKLTVVIGPPGTGKSQVVASIVLNAALRNEKVLLASFNHKAVQVVEEKLNKFAAKPFIVRLGKQNDLRQALSNYLNWLLHAQPNVTKTNELNDSKKILSDTKDNRNNILETLDILRKKRNVVLRYFNQFEENVRKLGEEHAGVLLRKYKEKKQIEKRSLLSKSNRITAQYLKTLNDIHKIKDFENVLDELENANKNYSEESIKYFKLWLETLPLRLNEINRVKLQEFISILNSLSQGGLTTRVYSDLMSTKNKLMKEVSCFLNAWSVNNLSANGEIPLEEGFFDLVVIDEASQCNIASAIPLLYRAKRAIILGDPFQLKHITTLRTPRSLELMLKNNLTIDKHILYDYVEQSLYHLSESRIKKGKVIRLNEHFRSHADIITFSRQFWYENDLLISTDYRNLSPQIGIDESAVEWLDVVGNINQIENSGAYITEEIDMVVNKVIDLIRKPDFSGEIGVVTPFKHQAKKIRDQLNKRLTEIEIPRVLVDDAVKFQGDEKDIVIYSIVVAENMPYGVNRYHEETPNLLNVAVTRARAKLIVVGNLHACLNSNIKHINEFARYVNQLLNGTIRTIEAKAESPYEKILHAAMLEAGLKPIPQYVVGQYRLDFALIVGEKQLDIEVDGKQFHTDWAGERLKSDIIRNQRLQNLGWTVLRLWSYEIRDQIDYCIQRIKKEIENASI